MQARAGLAVPARTTRCRRSFKGWKHNRTTPPTAIGFALQPGVAQALSDLAGKEVELGATAIRGVLLGVEARTHKPAAQAA